MTSTLTAEAPIALAESRTPEWYQARRGGITATEIRDWNIPAKRRKIINEKVSGETDTRDNRYFAHGRYREPFILDWAIASHGVVPEGKLHAHPANPRHLATPDGHLASFHGEAYQPGPGSCTVEIKTSSKDMTPGPVDGNNCLISVTPNSPFDKALYMRQIQWQMYVMNAEQCLYIWEQFDNTRTDPETGLFVVTSPPEFTIIRRDQDMIDGLIAEADAALGVIDNAIASTRGGLPPVNDLPTDEALLLSDLFAAREAVAVAEAARDKAWAALVDLYETRSGGEDFSDDKGMAVVTRSTPVSKPGKKFDRALAEKRAPKALEKHDAFIARYTVETPGGVPGKPRFTITDRRGKD